MAAGRSLMAWIRTGLSMIGFGFTIYKFLQGLQMDMGISGLNEPLPRAIGVFLLILGTLSVSFGVVEYLQAIWPLYKKYGIRVKLMPIIFAALIAALGLTLLIGIVLKIRGIS
jgi:putative membrane protein